MPAIFELPPSRLLALTLSLGAVGCSTKTTAAPDPAAALGEAFAHTVARVRPSVVYIEALRAPGGPGESGEATGSGFVARSGGIVLTNNHVVDHAQAIAVRLFDGRVVPAKIRGQDRATDLAVLELPVRDLRPLPFGDASRVQVGDLVLAIGNPLGGDLSFTVTAGIVSALGRQLLDLPAQTQFSIQDYTQIDAALNPGSSGGPVVNGAGEVIGVAGAIESSTGFSVGYGFAIPGDLAQAVLEHLLRFGRVHRAVIGAVIEEASVGDARWAGLPARTGVSVQQILPNSPADLAKLVPGDVLLSVDGISVSTVGGFQKLLAYRPPGDTVAIVVARVAGRRDTLHIPVTSLEAGDSIAPPPVPKVSSEPADARLGLAVEAAPAALLTQWRVESKEALLITGARPGGPSWGVVLRPGRDTPPSLLIKVNGVPVTTTEALRAELSKVRAGDAVTLEIFNPVTGPRIRRVVAGASDST
jgi:serine protease Do